MAYTTINKSSDYFNTKLYTGNGGTQSITGVGFQPDWCWIKNRETATGHRVIDAVRGNTKTIYTNATQGEETVSNMITSFDSDGFSLGNDGGVNGNGNGTVSWNWKANGSGSANTDGSINSTVSANTTAGFSIVSFTTGSSGNNTFGHGLGSTPSLIIVRPTNSTSGWFVYHKTLGNGNYLRLNDTDASASSALFGNTTPTSSVFTINSTPYGGNLPSIAYCFAEKTGYSKIGSFVSNGNNDGSFIYTGFKSSFILLKKSSGSGTDWYIFNNKSPGYNDNNKSLRANTSQTEAQASGYSMDILSNGFKIRTSNTALGESGATYIYYAVGQSLVGSNNVPCTAR